MVAIVTLSTIVPVRCVARPSRSATFRGAAEPAPANGATMSSRVAWLSSSTLTPGAPYQLDRVPPAGPFGAHRRALKPESWGSRILESGVGIHPLRFDDTWSVVTHRGPSRRVLRFVAVAQGERTNVTVDHVPAVASIDETGRGRWLGLAMLSLGVAMIIVDATIVNVSVPAIIRDLDLSGTEAEWVNTTYALTFAALLITLGRLGDQRGRRKMYLLGLVIFMVASVIAGFADSGIMLIGARLLQGVGGAIDRALHAVDPERELPGP